LNLLPPPPATLRPRFLREDDLTPAQQEAIRQLLIRAFARTARRFATATYWGARPEFRLWLETPASMVVAHLDYERRMVGVGDRDILIAGVGEVAVHPDWQGRGLGRRLLDECRAILEAHTPVDYGYLNCLAEIAGFYTAVGWQRTDQPSVRLHPDTGERTLWTGATMILPVREPLERWPPEETVDLRGMSW
jgi:aminoglycoside 2'-N-acetyltransferase I